MSRLTAILSALALTLALGGCSVLQSPQTLSAGADKLLQYVSWGCQLPDDDRPGFLDEFGGVFDVACGLVLLQTNYGPPPADWVTQGADDLADLMQATVCPNAAQIQAEVGDVLGAVVYFGCAFTRDGSTAAVISIQPRE